MKLLDVLTGIDQFPLIEDPVIGALLHSLPKEARNNLFNAPIFHPIDLDFSDFLIKDDYKFFVLEKFGDIGGEQ